MRKGELKAQIKHAVQKGAILSVFAITPIALTGCSFNFKSSYEQLIPDSFKQKFESGADSLKDLENVYNALGNLIDGTELKENMNEDDLEALFEGVIENGKEVEKQTGLEFVQATLIRVVDGDTIVVDIDGEEQKVRLIGMDTPESVASKEYLERTGKQNTELGRTASQFTKDILKNVKTLWLEKDVSDTDKYGRKLRYVWLEKPEDKENIYEISSKMLNAILIKEGYALVKEYPPDTHYNDSFEYIYDMSHEDGYADYEH